MKSKDTTLDDTLKAVEYYIKELKGQGIVVNNRDEWIEMGFEFASLGEVGRQYFHEISISSSKYDLGDNDMKFDELLKDHNGDRNIESFFHRCIYDLHIDIYKPDSKEVSIKKSLSPKEVSVKSDEEKWCYNLNDVFNAPPLIRLWKYFLKGSVNAIVSSSDAGKSTLVRNLTYAVIAGEKKFLGWELNCPKRSVIIISTEDDLSAIKEAMLPLVDKSKVIGDVRFVLEGFELKERLEMLLKDKPTDLVFIDTYGDAVAGEYDAKTTRPFLTFIRDLCRKYDATPVFVHHTNKVGENIPDKSQIKGAGDFEQAARTVLMLTEYRGSRWLALVKGNSFEKEEKEVCYRIDFDPAKKKLSLNGETMERQQIIRELRDDIHTKSKTDIDWPSVFDGKELRRVDLIKFIIESSGLSESGARERIKKMLESGRIQINENKRYELL